VEGNVETLVLENAQLRREIAELAKRVEILAEQNAWLKQRFFGRSSEALSLEEQRQLKLFDEAEQAAAEPDSTQGNPTWFALPSMCGSSPSGDRCRRPFRE